MKRLKSAEGGATLATAARADVYVRSLFSVLSLVFYGAPPGALGSATRHTGHVFFVQSHSRRQASWNL